MTLTTLVFFGVLATTVAALKDEKVACGQAFTRKSEAGQDKVIVGPDTHLGDWPWLAFLSACDENHCWDCSASLVLQSGVDSYVQVGSVDDQEGGQWFHVERYHFFDNTTSATELMYQGHDILVAKLNASVTFSDTVGPICLSEAKLEDHTTYVVAAGFGKKCPDNSSCERTDFSRESIIPLKPVEFCRKAFVHEPVADSDICAGSDHRDTTRGDSGGPIQFELNKRWHLAGVTSRGPDPQDEQYVMVGRSYE